VWRLCFDTLSKEVQSIEGKDELAGDVDDGFEHDNALIFFSLARDRDCW
jgi:hypothetical protein